MRIVAIGDIHMRTSTPDPVSQLLEEIEKQADVLVLAGDLTDNGLPEEAELLVQQMSGFSAPVLAVLGNHDHEGGQAERLAQIFSEAGLVMLDGSAHEIDSVGFVGAKGFCGGFDKTLIQPFGEQALKTFIQASINEAVQIENAAAKLSCQHKVAVLHYAPVRDTLLGEPEELFPFLGCSRLASALDRQGVDLIVHGHAHHGSPSGRTQGGIPVHNVSRFVQLEHTGQPYCVIDL
jgi:uncharacterized protein